MNTRKKFQYKEQLQTLEESESSESEKSFDYTKPDRNALK